MPIFPLHYNLLLSQWNLTLPIFFEILILTNKSLPKSFEDMDNDLSLYKPVKNNLQAGKELLFLNLYLLLPPFLVFSFPLPRWCTPHSSVNSVALYNTTSERKLFLNKLVCPHEMKELSCCGSHKMLAAEYMIKFISLFFYLVVYLACQLCSNAEHIHSPTAVPD